MSEPQMLDNTMLHHRFHFLDALRGIAAAFVLYWHLPSSGRDSASYLSVDFFGCLGGFVIAHAYDHRLREAYTFGRFALARATRLYPMYLFAIVLGSGLGLALTVMRHGIESLRPAVLLMVALSFAGVPNLRIGGYGFLFPYDIPVWTLVPEIIANLVYAGMLRLRFGATRSMAIVCAGMFLPLAAYVLTRGTVDLGASNTASGVMGIPRLLFSVLAGVLVQRFRRRRSGGMWPVARSAVAMVLLCATLSLLLLSPASLMRGDVFTLITLAFFFPGIVLLGSFCEGSALNAPFAWLGQIAYPVYLLHDPLFSALSLPWLRARSAAQPTLYVVLAIVATVALSQLVLTFYDIPVRAWLTRIAARQRFAGSSQGVQHV